MKTISIHYSFADIISRLSKQDPEEKLKIAFRLTDFVRKIYKAGKKYGKANYQHRARTAA